METQVWDIVGGPSKYDFIEALSFRKQYPQKVRFKIRSKSGLEEEFEVEIFAIMSTGEREGGEGHWWRFVASPPAVSYEGYRVTLHFHLVGIYSTGGKNGRTGSLRSLDHDQCRLVDAAFGNIGAWDELKEHGFKLPDTKLARAD